tara:strand:+ start:9866 stop:10063 length:198 start_codon:yes stop_codon:yes gene_type:complete
MIISRKSAISGKVRRLDLDITENQINDYIDGFLVQDAFPNLSVDEREFFITGITVDEWCEVFGDE